MNNSVVEKIIENIKNIIPQNKSESGVHVNGEAVDERYKVQYVKKNLLKSFYSQNRKLGILISFLIVLSSVLGISIALVMQFAINAITDNESLGRFLTVICISAFILFLTLFVNFINGKLKNTYSKKFLETVKDEVFSDLMKKNVVSFEKNNTGDYLSFFQMDIMRLELEYVQGRWMIISSIATCTFGIFSMLQISWKLSLVVLGIQMIPTVFSFFFGKKLVEYEKDSAEKRAKFVSESQDYLRGFALIKSFSSEKLIKRRFSFHNRVLEESMQNYSDRNIIIEVMNEGFGYLMIIGLFFFGGIAVLKSSLKMGSIIACFEIMSMVSGPFSVLSMQVNLLRSSNAIFAKLYDLIFDFPEQKNNQNNNAFSPKLTLNDCIQLNNVSFSYDKKRTILKNVSCKFEKGKKYALVGNSGSGKSTILKLLQGYYDDYEGDILFDKNNLRDIDMDSISKLVSIVQQDVFIFNATVKDNITLFNHYPYKELEIAINQAGLTKFIESHGLDYYCGENGRDLSGGEMQRISIARCILRESELILFDEATSALDNITALQVEQTINSLNNTCIVITHKLNLDILRQYDKVLVFDNGVIAEEGPVDELMNNRGAFYNLYKAFENL